MRVLAFYLPQFHPIPENDEWWGPGFTEWVNVAKARPLFKGHQQPNLPGELGFYDLRFEGTRVAQAELAAEHGIDGFIYWHYWFAGRRILDAPVEDLLASRRPDFPFCLAWANQTWSGVWHGLEDRVLIEQQYPGEQDHIDHFHYLLRFMQDERYIRVEGAPLLYIYKPGEIPNIREVLALWRRLAVDAGLSGLFVVGESMPGQPEVEHLDATVSTRLSRYAENSGLLDRVKRRVIGGPVRKSYEAKCEEWIADCDGKGHYPSVLPNWDNTPRAGVRGVILQGASPSAYGAALAKALREAGRFPGSKQLVFVKSWNEWAEGNYLEPDRQYGRGWLNATLQAREEYERGTEVKASVKPPFPARERGVVDSGE